MNKFNYREIDTTTIANKRFYKCTEELYLPSITTVLGTTMEPEKKKRLDDWRNALGPVKADKVAKDAADRGTNVHLMIEQFLKGEEINVPNASVRDKEMYNSLRFNLKRIDEVYGLEIPLYSNVLKVAGRADCIGIYGGKESIIDFKTSTRIKTDEDIKDYWLQCTFYALAHNEMYGTNIETGVVLMAVENGIPEVWQKDLIQFVGPLAERIENFYKELKI